jgi:hypothetical protein
MVSQTIYMVKTIDWYGMATGVLDWSGGMMAGQALGGIFPALVNILVISLQVRIWSDYPKDFSYLSEFTFIYLLAYFLLVPSCLDLSVLSPSSSMP